MDVVSDVLGGHMKLVGGVRKILQVKIQDPGPGGNCAATNNHHHKDQMSTKINKFKLAKGVNKNGKKTISRKMEENVVSENVNSLADEVSPMFKKFAPEAFKNMTKFDHLAGDCRVGHSEHGMFIKCRNTYHKTKNTVL